MKSINNFKIKYLFLSISIFLFIIFYSLNVNSQISTIIPAERLPDNGTGEWYKHWINAGSHVLTTGIFVKECITVTEQGVVPYTGDLNYQTYDPTCPNSDIINSLT